jgi:hypothetical protein
VEHTAGGCCGVSSVHWGLLLLLLVLLAADAA